MILIIGGLICLYLWYDITRNKKWKIGEKTARAVTSGVIGLGLCFLVSCAAHYMALGGEETVSTGKTVTKVIYSIEDTERVLPPRPGEKIEEKFMLGYRRKNNDIKYLFKRQPDDKFLSCIKKSEVNVVWVDGDSAAITYEIFEPANDRKKLAAFMSWPFEFSKVEKERPKTLLLPADVVTRKL